MSLFDIVSQSLEINSLNILLHILLEQYFFNSYCTVIVSDQHFDIKLNLTFIYLKPNNDIDELTTKLLEVTELGCTGFIVDIGDPKFYMKSHGKVNDLSNIRRGNRKIVFLLPHDTKTLEELVSMKETAFIPNVLFIVSSTIRKHDCQIFHLVSHTFMGREENKPLFLDKWDSCTQKFDYNVNLFPNNMKDLKGRNVTAAGFTFAPYIMFDLDTNTSPTGRDGLEIKIVEEFCRWINCKLRFLREEKDQWGTIYDNITGTGVMGRLADDVADIGIGGFYVWYEMIFPLDYSASYARTSVLCVAPSPRILSTWALPFLPFTWNVWYAVCVTFALTCVGLGIAERFTRDNVMLAVFGMIIAQGQDMGNSWRVRAITVWMLGASLVLTSAYGAGLATTFTVPKYEPSIDTIQDLVDRKMEWGAPQEAWTYSLLQSKEPLMHQLTALFRCLPHDELRRRTFTRDMAFSMEKFPGGHFAIPKYLSQQALLDMTLMAEDFYFGECMTLFRKSSPFKEKMTELVEILHQSGILLIWETQIALKHLNFKNQEIIRLSRSKNDRGFTKPLNTWDVMGIFLLYGMGSAISILVFILERIFWSCKRKIKQNN